MAFYDVGKQVKVIYNNTIYTKWWCYICKSFIFLLGLFLSRLIFTLEMTKDSQQVNQDYRGFIRLKILVNLNEIGNKDDGDEDDDKRNF